MAILTFCSSLKTKFQTFQLIIYYSFEGVLLEFLFILLNKESTSTV